MKQQINLYKSLGRPAKNWLKDQLVVAIMMGFVGLLCLITFFQILSMEFYKSKLANLQKQYVAINANFVKEQRGIFELTRVQQELAAKTKLLELLHVSLTVLPTCPTTLSYFQSLASAQVPGLWLTNFQIEFDSRNMSFTGKTYDPVLIVNWLKALGKTPCFTDVKFYTINVERAADEKSKKLVSFTVVSSRIKAGDAK